MLIESASNDTTIILHLQEDSCLQSFYCSKITMSEVHERIAAHLRQLCSSEPSPQSLSPSHNSCLGIQILLLHVNSVAAQVVGTPVGQFISSEPSPQSSMPSQCQLDWMQCLLLQVKACDAQVTPGEDKADSGINKTNNIPPLPLKHSHFSYIHLGRCSWPHQSDLYNQQCHHSDRSSACSVLRHTQRRSHHSGCQAAGQNRP